MPKKKGARGQIAEAVGEAVAVSTLRSMSHYLMTIKNDEKWPYLGQCRLNLVKEGLLSHQFL